LVKLLIMSDIHESSTKIRKLRNQVRGNDGYDAILIAGDITHFKPYSRAVELLEEIYSMFRKPIYFVPGNCDDPRLIGYKSDKEIYNVHNNLVVFREYHIYGVAGSTKTPFNTWIEWSEDYFEKFISRIWSVDATKLILVTHSPIYGFFDEINGENVGSKALRRFLEEHGGLVWVTGHMHEYSGYVFRYNTLIVHPGPFMHGYYGELVLSGGEVNVFLKKLN